MTTRRKPRAQSTKWTADDDAQLLQGISAGVDRTALAAQLGRSKAAMNTRLRKLRLVAKGEGRLPDPTYNRRVEPWEDQVLLDLYEDRSVPIDEIAAKIGRSRSSVYRQAAELGLTRQTTPEERHQRRLEQQRKRREAQDKEKDTFKKGVKHDPAKRGTQRELSSNPWLNV